MTDLEIVKLSLDTFRREIAAEKLASSKLTPANILMSISVEHTQRGVGLIIDPEIIKYLDASVEACTVYFMHSVNYPSNAIEYLMAESIDIYPLIHCYAMKIFKTSSVCTLSEACLLQILRYDPTVIHCVAMLMHKDTEYTGRLLAAMHTILYQFKETALKRTKRQLIQFAPTSVPCMQLMTACEHALCDLKKL